ncbi:binding-protein-dependent transport systems inner membrane component [Caldicellulosiruptor obsidiansis OB47]|uniref:Binding-protein-dependent transport systems inner membrane component n=1 Tax=Caldicellulosiruptor obsidiansis (strain ATCC BAA-2073 / JCM 16842 / OB47) TaxID=608506 RepID=D9TH93_CALOO|nr:carbohydrate ABC transporter permease [Caldicellulosiruptor obsidiansis]ADL41458.1 binding-protein-dependent transport systems inner membrane component [Caldicellulosiruptor obsidiansis OB47]
MYAKYTKISTVGKIIILSFLTIYSVITLFPILWLAYNSVKTNNDFLANPFSLPSLSKLQLKNYYDAWVTMGIQKFTLNSLIISCTSVLLSLIISSMAAYAIERMIWNSSQKVLNYFLAGIMVPIQIILIPLFINFKKLNLLDSRIGLLIPTVAFALPTSIYILTGFYKAIPRELEEAALIDGCSVYKIFYKIILPLTMPAFVTIAVFNFLGAWNDLLIPLVLIQTPELMTLPVGLLNFRGMYGAELTKMFAAVFISAIPSIIIYFVLQDKLLKGMIAGAVKG